jgi:hypothetical protein
MMKILRRDTAAEIRKTTDAASLAAAKLVTLREERRKLLSRRMLKLSRPLMVRSLLRSVLSPRYRNA